MNHASCNAKRLILFKHIFDYYKFLAKNVTMSILSVILLLFALTVVPNIMNTGSDTTLVTDIQKYFWRVSTIAENMIHFPAIKLTGHR